MDRDVYLDSLLMIIIKCVLSAVISIVVNILFQHFFFLICSVDNNISLYLAMATGTLAGLLVKYILDKHFIFHCVLPDRSDNVRKFVRYSLMGVVTTAVFWGTETLFHYLSDAKEAKYIGGAIGLTIGYTVKYQLDKRFVFVQRFELKPS